MRTYEKSNPGCYHRLIEYLAEKTGISATKEIVCKTVWKKSPHTGKNKLVYRACDITVAGKDGQRYPFMENEKRFDARGIEADYFIVAITRPVDEFGVKVNNAGNYRDSLCGGWYSNCEMVEVDGKYFAYMECSCR